MIEKLTQQKRIYVCNKITIDSNVSEQTHILKINDEKGGHFRSLKRPHTLRHLERDTYRLLKFAHNAPERKKKK